MEKKHEDQFYFGERKGSIDPDQILDYKPNTGQNRPNQLSKHDLIFKHVGHSKLMFRFVPIT